MHTVFPNFTAGYPYDFLRSDVLAETGDWRVSDVMDGSDSPEPAATLLRMFDRAKDEHADVYVFGRFYTEGDGLHDTHMNQDSTKSFRLSSQRRQRSGWRRELDMPHVHSEFCCAMDQSSVQGGT